MYNGIYIREITVHTAIYGVHIRFWPTLCIQVTCRVGQNHIYTVYAVFLAGRSPYIRPYTVHIYGFGQPYTYIMVLANSAVLIWDLDAYYCDTLGNTVCV